MGFVRISHATEDCATRNPILLAFEHAGEARAAIGLSHAPCARKDAIASVDAVLFVTPEHNRSIPGGLKNAIDWASRPYGKNSFTRKPSAVIGALPGAMGTAVAQQSLRSVLSFCNAPQMNARKPISSSNRG